MPCDSGPNYNTDAKLRAECDRVTRLLCGVCRVIDKKGFIHRVDLDAWLELLNWWENHKRIDAARVAREQREENIRARRAALIGSGLAKLSADERAALGL